MQSGCGWQGLDAAEHVAGIFALPGLFLRQKRFQPFNEVIHEEIAEKVVGAVDHSQLDVGGWSCLRALGDLGCDRIGAGGNHQNRQLDVLQAADNQGSRIAIVVVEERSRRDARGLAVQEAWDSQRRVVRAPIDALAGGVQKGREIARRACA